MTMKPSIRAGFSLVEIMIALAIVGLIMAVAIPKYNEFKEKGSRTATIASLRNFKGLIEQYSEDLEGKIPEKLEDLMTRPSNLDAELAPKWTGYLEGKKMPVDGWGRKFQYKPTPGAEHEYELFSLGAKDGKQKGVKLDVWQDI